MRRSLQILSVFLAVLLAVRMMAQDTGGGGSDATSGGGGSSSDSSGGTGAGTGTEQGTGSGMGQGTTNGDETTLPQGGASQGQGGTGTGGLMEPGTETPGTGVLEPVPVPGEATEGPAEGSVLAPLPGGAEGPPAGSIEPIPGTTPAPTPAGAESVAAGTQGAVQTPPVTFTLPGGYGGSAAQTFTLGQGRLAKPPITFTASVSQGYDDNLFDATDHLVPTPTPVPGATPALERRIVDYIIAPPLIIPIFQNFRASARATPTPPPPLGKIGSAVSTVTIGAQAQSGDPRTVFTMDASLGADNYWDRPGNKTDYNGDFDLTMVHRITPRASLSLAVNTVYQKTPDFALINAPTNNGNGGAYLNGDFKADLTYNWTSRVSTVSSYDLDLNLEDSTPAQNLYAVTFGTQIRYTASARNTITAEIRDGQSIYPSNSGADNGSLYYIVGLDTYFSSRLRNSFGAGIQSVSYSGGGPTQTLPYFESATTLVLPRGAGVSWTNRVGAENSGEVNATAQSYRTGLSFSQPFSAKLVGSVSLAYNYFKLTDDTSSSGDYTQNQLQGSVSLGYNISPRLSLNLSYSYTDLLTTQVNSSYIRQQVYLGGTYTFK